MQSDRAIIGMTYIPHTDAERAEMLGVIGVGALEDMFADLPDKVLFPDLKLPEGCSEMEVARDLRDLAAGNVTMHDMPTFLGAGVYNHYVPAAVDHVLRRSEFYTSYTPYQPELSQGMLQAMFEYQSMICALTDMEVSNASHYDGATALAEAVLLALRAARGKRRKVIMSSAVHPHYRDVVRTYLRGTEASIRGEGSESADAASLMSLLDRDTAVFVVQNPNFLGQFEDVRGLADAVHEAGALLIVVADPISLGLFQPPGAYGADIVVADGQPLGIAPSFGGPHLGIFATRNDQIRRLVGRLVGETTDADGRRGYVLTLSTREQHIRRARATSNICTNAALTALAASVYLALLGKKGLRKVAELCHHKAHYAAGRIGSIAGLAVNPQAPAKPFFKEFVVALPCDVGEANRVLLADHGIIGGYDLGRNYRPMEKHMLLAVTETNTRDEIDRLADGLRDVAGRHG